MPLLKDVFHRAQGICIFSLPVFLQNHARLLFSRPLTANICQISGFRVLKRVLQGIFILLRICDSVVSFLARKLCITLFAY